MKSLKTTLLLFFLAFTFYSKADTWLGNAWRFITAPVRPVWGVPQLTHPDFPVQAREL